MSREPHTLAGAYAMHALGEEERAAFEAHLRACEECAEEERELRETTARLGAAVAAPPPAALRARVMSEIGVVRQLPPAVAPRPSRTAARRGRWPHAATALAAAAVAVAASLGVLAVRAQGDLDRARQEERALAAELGRQREDAQRVADVLAAPDARTARSRGGGETTAKIVVSHARQAMVFLCDGLPALPGGRTYQLWRIGPAGALPDATTVPDAAGRTVPIVLGAPGDATQVGVTVEPTGGSPRPTTTPVLLMDVPSA
ncbi:hypothetical protein Ssi03_05280 [Sphaerisporangium siamense]|uniref:Regulator of SigK n=1 Tax=Sphaerisporangium siamense TaxID=795645 RepID=A0A7W7GAL1_9ACTN|nr:anti-sigma factor [Sphaerisporangium siamense]MBB4704063.1 anti-sigma-K factor RskA [Sphaerisporangium siamense]GII82538.1 hypothetical protein Ssi03_05280 [Sphaerisporangium siamense]